jgi:2-succinyl-6-hydroxy-2,4-cyclohexadiene-1-carboxylate synthase
MSNSLNIDRWHYISIGDRSLPPLLLLHGWMGSSLDYFQPIELLTEHFYCIAIDLPGHGKTETSDYGFAATASGIIGILDELKISKCALTGYSFGGRLALYLWLNYPTRFSRLLLESASLGLPTTAAKAARIASDKLTIERLNTLPLAEFIDDWYRQPIFIGMTQSDRFTELVERRLDNRIDRLVRSILQAGLARQPYLGDRMAIDARPISLSVGELDRKFVNIGREITRSYPHVTLNIAPNCSHNLHFQQPSLWAKYILETCQPN